MPPKKEERTPIKRARKKPEEKEAEIAVENTAEAQPAAPTAEQENGNKAESQLAQVFSNDGNQQSPENPSGAGQNKFYPPRRDQPQQFNVEFDGVIWVKVYRNDPEVMASSALLINYLSSPDDDMFLPHR